MNPAVKAIADKARSKAQEAKSILEKSDATAEELKRAGELADEAEALQQQADKLGGAAAKVAAVEKWDSEAVNTLPQPGAATKTAGAGGSAGKTEINLLTGEISESGAGILSTSQMKATVDTDYLKSFEPFLRAGGLIEKVKSAAARKALAEGIDSDGGYLVPAQILAGILMKEPAATRLLDHVQVVTVSSDRAQMLRSIYEADDLYSSAVRVYKTAEGATATATDKPVFGTLTIDVHSFTAELAITRQLLEDTAFDITGFITEQFRIAYRNHAAAKILTGTGVGEHYGILTRAGQAGKGPDIVKSGHASQVTWDGLRRIKNAVPEQYDTNSYYVFNKKSTQDAIEALVDGDDRPLWPEAARSGLVAGTPGTLQGYPYLREARMPDVAANAYSYLFGDPRGYARAIRLGLAIEPYRELEARRGMVVFLARFREGGEITEPWRLRVGKIAA